MGNTSSKQKCEKHRTAVLILGPQQSKLNVTFKFLVDNFGCFKKKSCLPICVTEGVLSFQLPISESIMLNIINFITKGKPFKNNK